MNGIRKFFFGWTSKRNHLLGPFNIICRVHALIHSTILINAELQERPHDRISPNPSIRHTIEIVVHFYRRVIPTHNLRPRNHDIGGLTILVLEQVNEVQLVSRFKITEINHNIVSLCDSLSRQLAIRKVHSVLHHIAVIGNHIERNRLAALIHQGNLEISRDRPIQQTKAILACSDIQIGFVEPVHSHHIANESTKIEGIKPKLTFLIPSLVSQNQIHIVVPIPPIQCGPTWES